MPRRARPARPVNLALTPAKAESASPADFSDRESQRVLTAAARAVSHELGRQAGRQYFAELIGRHRMPE